MLLVAVEDVGAVGSCEGSTWEEVAHEKVSVRWLGDQAFTA